jgi:isopenicillin N synthase-like dioxygenase
VAAALTEIPLIDVSGLFDSEVAASVRSAVDAMIIDAAHDAGFLVLRGLPSRLPLGPESRAGLLRVFDLPDERLRRLWRQTWAPDNPNVYRGFFPLEGGLFKHGIDIGPERVGTGGSDALAEPTPLPSEAELPGPGAAQLRGALGGRGCFDALDRASAGLG